MLLNIIDVIAILGAVASCAVALSPKALRYTGAALLARADALETYREVHAESMHEWRGRLGLNDSPTMAALVERLKEAE